MNPQFQADLRRLIDAAAAATGQRLDIISGDRSPQHQADLYRASGGSGMVGTPMGSRHVHGIAADLGFGGTTVKSLTPGSAIAWMHDHAGEYNLHFPLMSGATPRPEPWHIEPIWSRGADWQARAGGKLSDTVAGTSDTDQAPPTEAGGDQQTALTAPPAAAAPQVPEGPNISPEMLKALYQQNIPNPLGGSGAISDVFSAAPANTLNYTVMPRRIVQPGAPLPTSIPLT